MIDPSRGMSSDQLHFAIDQHATQPQRRRAFGRFGEFERREFRRLSVVNTHAEEMPDEGLGERRH